mgnify:CR=1 FL=1
MGKRIYCIKCGKNLPSSRRLYCSNYCQIEFYNNRSRPVFGIDKWGRKYLACQKCKTRLKKREHLGKTTFKCDNCWKAGNHKSLQNSMFMEKTFKKGGKVRKVILEITERNRNWHYVDGHPVLGFKKAIKYFRALVYSLEHRDGYTPIS